MKRLLFILLAIAMLCGVASATPLPGYNYYILHMINGSSSGALTNYPITMVLNNTSGTSSGETCYVGSGLTRSDWGDVRFTVDNVTELPYWIETASLNATAARFWINMSSIASGNTTQTPLFIYYGNASKTNVSNGSRTFPLFDDFDNGTTLDTNKWGTYSGNSISNGILTLSSSGGTWARITTLQTFSPPYQAISKVQPTSQASTSVMFGYGIHQSGTNGYVGVNSVNGYRASSGDTALVGANLQKFNGGWTTINQNSYSYTQNYWYKMIATCLSSGTNNINVSFTNNSSTPVIVSAQGSDTSYTSGYISVADYGHTSGTTISNVDWVLVRPYVSSEPTHSTYTSTANITVTPVANFTANQTSGAQPLNVSFTDNSTNTPTSWLWQFGDGNTSTTQNTTHLYYTGNWSVNFSATNAAGTNWSNGTWINVTSGVSAPVANFSTNVSSGYPSFDVLFTDASTNAPTTWNWSFGDGTANATTQNVTHTYNQWIGNTSAAYTTTLTTGNAGGNGTKTVTSNITAYPLTSTMTANNYTGKIPLLVQFNTTFGNGTATNWSWNFGDTNTSTIRNATNTYYTVATFPVILNASNSYSYNWSRNATMITATAPVPPVASFNTNVTGGPMPLSVLFNDTSTETPTSWLWQWGDGTANATTQNVTHIFVKWIGNSTATYNVNLTATNADGSNTSTNTVITAYPLVSNITSNVTSGVNPFDVQFNNTITNGTATTFLWNWSDGGTNGTTQNTTHRYSTTGTFSVLSNISDAYSFNWTYKSNYMTSLNQTWPTTDFVTNVSSGYPPFDVMFNDTSTNATSWYWEFGDGETSTTQNLTHRYDSWIGNTTAVYAVNHSATNTNGTVWSNATLCETAFPITHTMTSNVSSGVVTLHVQFNTTFGNGTATNWAWVFGNGNTSTTRNATNTYPVVGTYGVILNSSNSYSYNWSRNATMIIARPYLLPFPGYTDVPTNPNLGTVYTDTNGNTRNDFSDPVVFFTYLEWAKANEPLVPFDYNGNGRLDYNDPVVLFYTNGGTP